MLNTTLVSAPNAPTVLSSAGPLGPVLQAAEPANITKAPAALCELEGGGQSCGVQAVGRCAYCKRAFCTSHQAYETQIYGPIPYVDMCTSCLEARRAREAERRREAEAPRQCFLSGTARKALLTANVPTVEIYRIERRQEVKELKRGFFRSPQFQRESVEVLDSIGHGWILGELKWWQYDENGISSIVRTCLTALLDLSLEDWQKLSHDYNNGTLACVRSCSGGYEVLTGGRLKTGDWADGRNDSWIEGMQSVKRLIGESN